MMTWPTGIDDLSDAKATREHARSATAPLLQKGPSHSSTAVNHTGAAAIRALMCRGRLPAHILSLSTCGGIITILNCINSGRLADACGGPSASRSMAGDERLNTVFRKAMSALGP